MADVNALAKAIEKALKASGETDPHVFTKDEVATLQKVIAFVEKLQALKWFGQILLWCAVTVGTVIVNWERIKGFFQ
jgi:hypothetical protein